jgi:hypothetical protein
MPYHFITKHRKGKSNPADAPSRPRGYVPEGDESTQLLDTLATKLARVQAVTRSQKARDGLGIESLAGRVGNLSTNIDEM